MLRILEHQRSNTGTEREINWEDELSLVKQRLDLVSQAQVLYPGRCVSVSTVMEKRLYHLLNAQGILYYDLTSSDAQGNALQITLILGDKDRNYEFANFRVERI